MTTTTSSTTTDPIIDAWAAQRADLYLVIGRGADQLRDALQRAGASDRPRVVLAVHPDQDPLTAAQAACEVASSPGFLPQRVCCAVHPDEIAASDDGGARIHELAEAAGAGVQRYIVSASTFALHARRFVHHTLRNVAWYPGSTDSASLANLAVGLPAIIVAAGPSLADSLHDLRRVRHHALIIACDTAAPALLAAGIEPHAIASIDLQPHKQSALRSLIGRTDALLAQQQYCHPRISNAWRGPRTWFGTPSPAAGLLPAVPTVAETLSVAHAAFELGRHLGCSPLVLCGLDLSFTNGTQTHAPGCVGHWGERSAARAEVMATGLDSAPLPTLVSMQAMATSFEALIAQLPGDAQVWNATARGLMIRGARRASLDAVLDLGISHDRIPRVGELRGRELTFDIDAQLKRLDDAALDPPAALVRMAAFRELLATRRISEAGERDARAFVRRACAKAARALGRSSCTV
ncbi:MAG: 6-hydroxymethylpterin diphosphokinase MptE-like protein [Planctomycetota bacterium]